MSVHIFSMYILSIMYQAQYYCCEYNNIPDKCGAIIKLIILCSARWILKKIQVNNQCICEKSMKESAWPLWIDKRGELSYSGSGGTCEERGRHS